MEYVSLANGVKIPMVGLGTYPLQGEQLKQTLALAKKAGYQLLDTAGAYGNETDIGDCIRQGMLNRDDLFITSKVNWMQLRGRIRYLFLNRETVSSAYRHSCKRLGVDKLDLYLLHQPFEGFAKAYRQMMKLYEKGAVRAIGVCNFDIDELKRLYAECGVWPMVNQTEISPVNSFKDIIAFCQEKGIIVEAYSPFGRGHIVRELLDNELLKRIAAEHQRTVGQIVLRWIVQQGLVVIPRSTHEVRLQQNLELFDFQLTHREMAAIDSLNEGRVYGVNQVNKYAQRK